VGKLPPKSAMFADVFPLMPRRVNLLVIEQIRATQQTLEKLLGLRESSELDRFCLSGCFSKPPRIVVAFGGQLRYVLCASNEFVGCRCAASSKAQ
jgi:hypothetical protein